MCWSMEASAAFAAVGFAGSAYAASKRESMQLWVPLAYFSLMELLQAYTYLYIDNCDAPQNQVATLLSYIHITFQPFFINAMALYFIPQNVSRRLAPLVYLFCFIVTVLMTVKLYPFEWAEKCTYSVTHLCGERLCSVSGNWHLAWELPLNDFISYTSTYMTGFFLLPILYGSWRFALYQGIFHLFAYQLSDNINELPAIWCFISVSILIVAVIKRSRAIFYVNKWYFWNYPRFLSRD